MDDYKALYLKLFNATEDAINKLIEAQQECEEMYINFNSSNIDLHDSED